MKVLVDFHFEPGDLCKCGLDWRTLLTEADAWVLLTDSLALVIGEEHVRRKTTLGCVGICNDVSHGLNLELRHAHPSSSCRRRESSWERPWWMT